MEKRVFEGWGGSHGVAHGNWYEKDTRSERHVMQLLMIPKCSQKLYTILFLRLNHIVCMYKPSL